MLIIVQNTDPITANYAGNGIWWAVHTFDDYAVYKVNATYSGLDDVEINNATITINKANSTLTLNNIAFEYKGSGSTAVSFKGATGVKAKVLNQPKAKVIVKNNKITVSGLNIGTYTLSVTTIPDSDHNAVTKNVKIKVNKIKTKITAKKKTFKTKIKTKKYMITLKDSKGNAIKNAKVTLKVKGKLFKANTNKKGQATFKITNLENKGTFKATVMYKGNKYYNAVTKKNVQIIVR